MKFISYEELYKDLESWNIPKHDAVIGIARSGIIPATYFALKWNVPLSTVNTFGKFEKSPRVKPKVINNVLVIDDSMYTGNSIKYAKSKLNDKVYNYKYAVVYPKEEPTTFIDYYCKLLGENRVFQWNVFHHIRTKNVSFDMDGVLCRAPTKLENDYGDKYEVFLKDTEPIHIPTFGVNNIITGRIEKYRELTEKWLKKHKISYNRLIMRKTRDINIASYKAHHYAKDDSVMFIEDEPQQAFVIRYLSGKKVLCTTGWKMI